MKKKYKYAIKSYADCYWGNDTLCGGHCSWTEKQSEAYKWDEKSTAEGVMDYIWFKEDDDFFRPKLIRIKLKPWWKFW